MSVIKFKHQFDPNYKGTPSETYLQPVFEENENGEQVQKFTTDEETGERVPVMEPMASLCEPGNAMSIQEILKRQVTGLPTPPQRTDGMFLGIEVPRLEDLTDVQEYREKLDEQLKMAQVQIDAEIEAIKEKKMRDFEYQKEINPSPDTDKDGGGGSPETPPAQPSSSE